MILVHYLDRKVGSLLAQRNDRSNYAYGNSSDLKAVAIIAIALVSREYGLPRLRSRTCGHHPNNAQTGERHISIGLRLGRGT